MTLEQLMDNPYAWLILAICTILSFAYAIYMGVKSKEKKEISYLVNTHEIVRAGENVIPKFQVLYCEQPIKNLTVSRFAIWNSGNKLLNSTDIVDTKPLSIMSDVDGAEILDVSIIKCSEETNKFTVDKKSAHCADLKFDYMNRRDGIIVQILHTGAVENIFLTGLIKGGKKLKNTGRNTINIYRIKAFKIFDAISLGMILVTSVSLTVAIALESFEIVAEQTLMELIFPPVYTVICIVVGVLCVSTTIMSYQVLKRIYHINIPSALRDSMKYY